MRNRATDNLSDGVPIPESAVTTPAAAPACASPDEAFAPAVATAVEALLDIELNLEFPSGGRLRSLRE
ncbi:hypothetical protein ACFQJ7_06825 [Halovenus rubra]|uniref:Uncharacterized protein n=2 Tax=Halovenus rubra TaxID=869890 RepID=A0ABD5X449_9EURY|nr:hypothetical protein [Halovenus rubra]